jgi:hypothetical protein
MIGTRQPSLFDREQPGTVECHGRELADVLAALRERGAIAYAMVTTCPGSYRIHLDWRNAKNAFSFNRRSNRLNLRATLAAGASFPRSPCPDMGTKSPRLV